MIVSGSTLCLWRIFATLLFIDCYVTDNINMYRTYFVNSLNSTGFFDLKKEITHDACILSIVSDKDNGDALTDLKENLNQTD